jgi:hypothetical protein
MVLAARFVRRPARFGQGITFPLRLKVRNISAAAIDEIG